MRRSSKRKASANFSSEAGTAINPSHQPLDISPAEFDLNLTAEKTVSLPQFDLNSTPEKTVSPAQLDLNLSPNRSVRSARKLKWSLKNIKRECFTEEDGSGSPSVSSVNAVVSSLPVLGASITSINEGVQTAASVGATVSLLQVTNVSISKHDMSVQSADSLNVRVPSVDVQAASTASFVGVPSATSVRIKVSSLPVPDSSNSDVCVPIAYSKKLITSNQTGTSTSKNRVEVQSHSPSLTVASAVPELQRSSNKMVMNKLPAQSSTVVPASSSSTLSLASVATSRPKPQKSSIQQPLVPIVIAPRPAVVNNDPFRNLRLDIDNMSYEDILRLQEQIGYVSTGLSGKELVKARKITTYRAKRRKTAKDVEVDSKCCICQEEFLSGDKLGNLKCKHRYHLTCIEQWLQQKNLCPTCKTDAMTRG